MPFYDNFSLVQPSKTGSRIAGREADNILQAMMKVKNDIHSIYEIGPGRGPFFQSCTRQSIDYTCIDVSWSMLARLEVGKRINAFAPPLPLDSNAFDVAFASNVLEHMPDFRVALEFVKEMVRTIKVGGLVCHRVPNAMAWGMHFWNGDYSHGFPTTPRNVSQLYQDLELKIEALYPVSGTAIGDGARFLAWFGKLIPSWVVDHGANLRSRVSKIIYSAKTTLLLGFLIIGRKMN
jgi:SAM-dependent methyltransferase